MAVARPTIEALPAIPRDGEGPVFAAPWEAHAFAIAVKLSEQGLFTWSEWTDALSAEVEVARQTGDADLGDTYYHHWLKALEKLVEHQVDVKPALERLSELSALDVGGVDEAKSALDALAKLVD